MGHVTAAEVLLGANADVDAVTTVRRELMLHRSCKHKSIRSHISISERQHSPPRRRHVWHDRCHTGAHRPPVSNQQPEQRECTCTLTAFINQSRNYNYCSKETRPCIWRPSTTTATACCCSPTTTRSSTSPTRFGLICRVGLCPVHHILSLVHSAHTLPFTQQSNSVWPTSSSSFSSQEPTSTPERRCVLTRD